MAVVKTTRRGWFGLKRTTVSGPSSEGTDLAFLLGNEASKKRGGPTPGLKRVVALHKAATQPTR